MIIYMKLASSFKLILSLQEGEKKLEKQTSEKKKTRKTNK